MHSAKIVVHEPYRRGCRVILNFLGESIGQPREATSAHPHGKVLPLNKRRAHVLWVGVSAHNLYVASDASCGEYRL
jgi:hypothetical protein